MELEAKEHRFVILALKKLLQEHMEKLNKLSSEDDEYVFLSNDATLIDAMIKGFEEEYQRQFERQKA